MRTLCTSLNRYPPTPKRLDRPFRIPESPSIDRLREGGTEVVLFQTPVCWWTEEGDARDRAQAEIRRIAEERSLPFLDYQHGAKPSAVAGRPEYFWDWTHVSETGAQVFSRELWRDARAALPARKAGRPVAGSGPSTDDRD